MITDASPVSQRYEVVVVSKEFLELARELPEISASAYVWVGGKRIEGATIIKVAASMQETLQCLPSLIAQFTDPEKRHFRIVERRGDCRECAGQSKPCEHLGHKVSSLNRVYDIDINKIPKVA